MSFLSEETIIRIRKFTIPGFDGVPIVKVLRFFYFEIKKEGVTARASSVTFFFMLSIFPGLIFLFTLLPYLPIKNIHTQLLLTIKDVINNKEAYQMIRTTINDIANIPHQGLMSFGFIMAIYSAMSGVKALINAFDKAYEHTFIKRTVLHKNWVAFKLTFLIAILLIVSLTLIIAQNAVLEWFFQLLDIHNGFTRGVLNYVRYLIIMALFFFAISTIYYYGPGYKKKFQFISAGSTLATGLSILTSLAFSYFVNHFGQYNKIYGSIGSIIVIMLWMYFNAIILIIGFELNTSIALSKEAN